LSLLLLGGTGDARHLTTELFNNNVPVIYSVAGLVRTPHVPCEIVRGGFSQFATLESRVLDSHILESHVLANNVLENNALENNGLVNYIQDKNITAILDVTHPYAQKMSSTAVKSASHCNIPCWRFHRPEWEKQQGDNWTEYDSLEQLLPHLRDKKNVFLSIGQIKQEFVKPLETLLEGKTQRQIVRTAVKPKIELAATMHWIRAIGPFKYEDELALLKQFDIDVVVTKNSGGVATIAKLEAARKLNVPVLMLARPELPTADKIVSDPMACKELVLEFYKNKRIN